MALENLISVESSEEESAAIDGGLTPFGRGDKTSSGRGFK